MIFEIVKDLKNPNCEYIKLDSIDSWDCYSDIKLKKTQADLNSLSQIAANFGTSLAEVSGFAADSEAKFLALQGLEVAQVDKTCWQRSSIDEGKMVLINCNGGGYWVSPEAKLEHIMYVTAGELEFWINGGSVCANPLKRDTFSLVQEKSGRVRYVAGVWNHDAICAKLGINPDTVMKYNYDCNSTDALEFGVPGLRSSVVYDSVSAPFEVTAFHLAELEKVIKDIPCIDKEVTGV